MEFVRIRHAEVLGRVLVLFREFESTAAEILHYVREDSKGFFSERRKRIQLIKTSVRRGQT